MRGDPFANIAAECRTEGARAWVLKVLRAHSEREARPGTPELPPVLDFSSSGRLGRPWDRILERLDERDIGVSRIVRISASQAYDGWIKDRRAEARKAKQVAVRSDQEAPAIVSQRLETWDPHGWVTGPDGIFTNVSTSNPNQSLTLAHKGCRWQLVAHQGGDDPKQKVLWESIDQQKCLDFLDTINQCREEERVLTARIAQFGHEVRSKTIPDVIIRISDNKPGLIAEAFVEGSEGKSRSIGKVDVHMTPLTARHIIGEPTVSGSAFLIPDYRRGGLGGEMYNLLEQLCELPRVPHKMNGNVGGLSDIAEAFWRKRASERRVPGYNDPEADQRRAEWQESQDAQAISLLESTGEELAALAVVHDATGWPLEIVGEGKLSAVVCRMPDGRVLNMTGIEEQSDVVGRLEQRLSRRAAIQISVPTPFPMAPSPMPELRLRPLSREVLHGMLDQVSDSLSGEASLYADILLRRAIGVGVPRQDIPPAEPRSSMADLVIEGSDRPAALTP